ncbi:heterokaryon incompatibility protein-domain-containing protein [Bombardia bombarda]|uniref:Heterokaryon incompatibility protein-domain-containing protein n=1 Tax=Bombardia bombarda TaxID=252184 RepID=A0AA40CAG9_9PEZI|nr:heterokaryon incompatibility protein-domain-containing protein [Bombardia bombarda]
MAVSYCWAGYKDAERSCRIRDCTGPRRHAARLDSMADPKAKGKGRDENVYLSVGDGRVPSNEVLGRAVQYAAHEGLRCIWIDQACLPQDKSMEHQIGIQSMDMVYQRAVRTAGLLESPITSQEVFNALSILFAWAQSGYTLGETPGQDFWNLHCVPMEAEPGSWGLFDVQVPKQVQKRMARESCRGVLKFLDALAEDRWYSRAWILQESISAGSNLTLLFKTSPGLSYLPSPFVEQSGIMLPPGAGGDQSFAMTYKELRLLTKGLNKMMDEFFNPIGSYSRFIGSTVPMLGPDAQLLTEARRILDPDHMQRLHPAHMRCGLVNCSCKTHFVCNAASAITFLQGRQCLKAEDKAAIVANLCNYEIRLDTFQISTQFESLRVCLLALSLLNGDLSLLVPDHYELGNWVERPKLPLVEFPITFLHRIKKLDVEADSSCRFQATNTQLLRPGGALLPSFLWCVDREVDFASVRDKWG